MSKARLGAAVFAVVLLSACGSLPNPGASPAVSTSPSATAAETPSPTPTSPPSASPSTSPIPTPSPTPPAGFVCGTVTGGNVAGSTVSTVRVGQHAGYDRFVIEFAAGVPAFTVAPQGTTTFTRSPKGDQVTLEGNSGVLVTVHSVTNWIGYNGPVAFLPRYPFLRQAILVENYEGYQQWALGVRGTACVRVAVYDSPSRLVVDVAGI